MFKLHFPLYSEIQAGKLLPQVLGVIRPMADPGSASGRFSNCFVGAAGCVLRRHDA